jgi:hypothetical protein
VTTENGYCAETIHLQMYSQFLQIKLSFIITLEIALASVMPGLRSTIDPDPDVRNVRQSSANGISCVVQGTPRPEPVHSRDIQASNENDSPFARGFYCTIYIHAAYHNDQQL